MTAGAGDDRSPSFGSENESRSRRSPAVIVRTGAFVVSDPLPARNGSAGFRPFPLSEGRFPLVGVAFEPNRRGPEFMSCGCDLGGAARSCACFSLSPKLTERSESGGLGDWRMSLRSEDDDEIALLASRFLSEPWSDLAAAALPSPGLLKNDARVLPAERPSNAAATTIVATTATQLNLRVRHITNTTFRNVWMVRYAATVAFLCPVITYP